MDYQKSANKMMILFNSDKWAYRNAMQRAIEHKSYFNDNEIQEYHERMKEDVMKQV